MSLPTPSEVGEALITNLFPPTVANVAIDFAKNVGPNAFVDAGKLADHHALLDGSIMQDLIAAGKTVAKAAASALLTAAQNFINPPAKSSKKKAPPVPGAVPSPSEVGKFSDTVLQAVPAIKQLSLAAVPAKYRSDPHNMALFSQTLNQVADTTSKNFIEQAQTYINTTTSPKTGEFGGFFDTLKNIAGTVMNAASAIVPVVAPIIAGALTTARTQALSRESDGNVVTNISSSAVNATAKAALLSSYQENARNVALRSTQSVLAVAKQLHDKYTREKGVAVCGSDWWNAFVDAANAVSPVIGFFSPSLQLNGNATLADSDKVQKTALQAGIVAGAYTAQQMYPPNVTGRVDALAVGDWLDTLKSIAGPVASVIKTVAPIAVSLL